MQQAIIVRYRFREEQKDFAVKELNALLHDGWRVVQMSPMGGAQVGMSERKDLSAVFTCLVILEKP